MYFNALRPPSHMFEVTAADNLHDYECQVFNIMTDQPKTTRFRFTVNCKYTKGLKNVVFWLPQNINDE